MCEPLKRNPAREKKLPKHFMFDDAEYALGGIKPEQKTTLKPKETVPGPSETAQVAKLLARFIASANSKYHELTQREQQELASEEKEKTERTQPGEEGGPSKRVKLDGQLPKPHPHLASSLEKLHDGTAIRLKTEPGREMVGAGGKAGTGEVKKRGKYAPRSKSPKKKEEGGDPKSGKPFKRQSYHVAVAYRLYMQMHQSGLRANPDPTLFARQLKQKAQG